MVRRDAVVGDVLEDATNGTLEHEVTEAGLVATTPGIGLTSNIQIEESNRNRTKISIRPTQS